MIKDDIFTYIVNSSRINEAIDNIVDEKKYIIDFKQHFYLQMLEMDGNKLAKAYLNGYIDWLCIRVMLNQWRSKTSSFYYQYRDKSIKYDELIDDFKQIDDDKIDFDYKKAEDILKGRNDKFLDRQYHEVLFRLYFEDGYNYREISEMTGININSVAQSINRSIKYIKNKIE